MAFTFQFKSSTNENIQLNTFRNFNRVLLGDSIRMFYPLATLNVKDRIGLFSEILGFVEGSEWEFLYGDDEDTEAQINFKSVWKANQLTDFYKDYFISGHTDERFIDKHIISDIERSKSYQGIISSVINSVISPYNFLETVIETTGNNGIWGQGLIKDSNFIKELAKYAYSSNNGTEPLYPFIDLNGKFHFETISNMFNNQSIIELNLSQDNEDKYQVYTITDLDLIWGDLEKDIGNYKSKYFYWDIDSNEMKNEEKQITDIIDKSGKLPVLKNNANNIHTNRFFGFRNPQKETSKNKEYGDDEYTGWMNNYYKKQQTWLIMRVMMKGAIPQATTGQIVSTNINSVYEGRGSATEFTGDWAIIESKHIITQNYIPYTELYLARNYIDFNKDNVFKNDLI